MPHDMILGPPKFKEKIRKKKKKGCYLVIKGN